MRKRPNKPGAQAEIPSFTLPIQSGIWVITFIHIVCPLLFFTNLTRNPYYTQIALLNVLVAICGILWAVDVFRRKEWQLPRIPVEWPLLIFSVVAIGTTVLAWWAHEPLRDGIQYEGLRVWVFTIVNSVMAFYLPLIFTTPIDKSKINLSIWVDIILAFVWMWGWMYFKDFKSNDPTQVIWDPYGGFLWVGGLMYALFRTRHGESKEFFHLIFFVGVVASTYALMQYAGRDFIWQSRVEPYGGRPVSSFGNPNFLSSYLMLVSPLALAFAVKSHWKQSLGFLFVAVITGLGVLCTLTRSTYVGLLVTYLVMAVIFFKKEYTRRMVWFVGGAVVVLVLFILIFPKTPVTQTQSPLARLIEVFEAIESGESYGPWHQRLLIWSSAWDMVQERLLFGKGWGCFELFYPFYQGKYLMAEIFPYWRTHANNAHNVLLELWAQLGFVGTGVAIWLFVTLVWGGFRVFQLKEDNLSRWVTGALFAGLMGMAADNFFGNVSIFFAMPAFLFWWNMGALFNESSQIVTIQRPLKTKGIGLLAILVVFCLFVGVYFTKRWNQERYYFEGFKAAKAGLVEPSIKNLETAYKWFKGEVNSNYELGNSYARHGKNLKDKGLMKEARKYQEKSAWAYNEALRANPGYDEIYFNVGVVHAQLGEREQAISRLRTAIFINPLLRDAYSTLANQYFQSEMYNEASQILEQGVAVFPRDRDLWNNLGFAYSKLEQPQKRINAFRQSYMLDPSYKPAHQNLALAARDLHLREPLLEVPQLIKKMEDALAQSQYQAAKIYADKLVELMPTNKDAHLSLGNINFYLGDTDGAIREFETAIDMDPIFLQAHTNLGKVYMHLKQYEKARSRFEFVMQYQGDHSDVIEAMKNLPPKTND
jgi:tetratricopeptide (TPR) repeat protein/O-antigen ligase